MQELLHFKLRHYLAVHYPYMLLGLAKEGTAEVFIRGKVESILGEMDAMLAGGTPAYEVEVICMDLLIESLPASKYDYVIDILEETFAEQYGELEKYGIVLFEICNIISACGDLLENFDEEDGRLRDTMTGIIANYFDNPATVGHGV